MSSIGTVFSPRRGHAAAALGFVAALAIGTPRIASAALGGSGASVAADRATMRGTLSVTPMRSFDLHRITDPAGAAVSEYVDRGGTVFAVTWRGRRAPDLRRLLGAYYGRYLAAASLHRTGHHVVTVRAADFVLSVVRFQRSAFGRAYLPSRLPSGVTPAELR